VGLQKAGHLAFSDLCDLGKEEGGLFKLAKTYDVTLPAGFGDLLETLANDGCKPEQLSPAEGWAVIHDASSAVFEETLHCDSKATSSLQTLKSRYPAISIYLEE
jgi:hypothetical protein